MLIEVTACVREVPIGVSRATLRSTRTGSRCHWTQNAQTYQAPIATGTSSRSARVLLKGTRKVSRTAA